MTPCRAPRACRWRRPGTTKARRSRPRSRATTRSTAPPAPGSPSRPRPGRRAWPAPTRTAAPTPPRASSSRWTSRRPRRARRGEGHHPLRRRGLTAHDVRSRLVHGGDGLEPFGQVLRTASGEAPNRVWSTSVYDQDTGRLVKSTTDRETLNPSRLSTLAYAYDTVGNITSVTDTQSATRVDRQCFAYDPMGRLAHAWTAKTPGCPRSSAAQDAGPDRADVSPSVDGAGYWHSVRVRRDRQPDGHEGPRPHGRGSGRRVRLHVRQHAPRARCPRGHTSRTPSHGWTRRSAHRARRVTSQSTYAYDASGNTTERVIGGDTQSLSWDRRNKLTSADTDDDGTPDVTYRYDASGNRLVETTAPPARCTWARRRSWSRPPRTPADARRYYTPPGGADDGPLHGRQGDGPQADARPDGPPQHRRDGGRPGGRPGGDPPQVRPVRQPARHRADHLADRRTFLGVGIDDPKTGLTHIGAREYDASTGRFISADPIMDLTNPLQMNGYTLCERQPAEQLGPVGPLRDHGLRARLQRRQGRRLPRFRHQERTGSHGL